MKSIHPNFLTLTLAGLLSAASATALAQPMPDTAPRVSAPAPATGAPSVKSVDGNADREISLEEFKAQGGQGQAFPGIDANQDKSGGKGEFSKQSKPSTQRN